MRTRHRWLYWIILVPISPIIFVILTKLITGDFANLIEFLNTSALPMYTLFMSMAAKSHIEQEIGLNDHVWDKIEKADLLITNKEYQLLTLYSGLQEFFLPSLITISMILVSLLLFQETNLVQVIISKTTIALFNIMLMFACTILGIWLAQETKQAHTIIANVLGDSDESIGNTSISVNDNIRSKSDSVHIEDIIEAKGDQSSSKF